MVEEKIKKIEVAQIKNFSILFKNNKDLEEFYLEVNKGENIILISPEGSALFTGDIISTKIRDGSMFLRSEEKEGEKK